MDKRALAELMYAVLDGEATDGQTRELERRLAGDGRARSEFTELKRLFQALRDVPQAHPPEGLVAAVTAALPPRDDGPIFPQPSTSSRVFGHAVPHSGGDPSGDPATETPTPASEAPTRSHFMSQQSSRTFGNRKVWIGIGVAAAVVVVAQYGFDFPLGQDVTGTIVPAQRYRAASNGSDQVRLGAPAAATETSAAPATAAVVQGPDRSAADMAAKRSAPDRAAPDRAAADRAVVDRAAVDRTAADRTAADRAVVDRAAVDRTAADRAAADRAVVDRAAADRAAAERSSAERATLDRTAADRVGPSRQQ